MSLTQWAQRARPSLNNSPRLASRPVPWPATSTKPALPHIEWLQGDLNDRASLDRAVKDVTVVYLLSPASADAVALQQNLIDAATAAGVGYIIKHRGLGTDRNSPVALARWHQQTEDAIVAAGIRLTSLRPHFFMQNLLGFADSIKATGAFHAPLGSAAISMVDVRDIATLAVAILRDPAPHAGKVYDVTGPRAVSFADVALVLSDVLGKPVRYVAVNSEQARGAMLGMGMPEWLIDDMVTMYQFWSTGQAAAVSPAVREVSGFAGRDIVSFINDYAAAFRA